jgi:hypothetical protein
MGKFGKDKYVDIEVEIKHETNAALLVSDGDKDGWLPKSLIKDKSQLVYGKCDVKTITVPEWIAKSKGFI